MGTDTKSILAALDAISAAESGEAPGASPAQTPPQTPPQPVPAPAQEQGEPTIEINGQNLTLDQIKEGYMRQEDYTKKTQSLAEKQRETEVLKQMLETHARPGMSPDEIGDIVKATLNGLQNTPVEPQLADDDYISGKDFNAMLEAKLKAEREALTQVNAGILTRQQNAERAIIYMNIDTRLAALESKYPDADIEECRERARLTVETTRKLPDFDAMMKKSHDARSPSNIKFETLPEDKKEEIAKKYLAEKEAREKAAEPRPQQGVGGGVPFIEDEQLEKIKKIKGTVNVPGKGSLDAFDLAGMYIEENKDKFSSE